MRNKYPGKCYQCGKEVGAGQGHFQRFQGSWRTHHAKCAIEFREARDNAKSLNHRPAEEE